MDEAVRKHRRIEAADPECVIVTLFRCDHGFIRGWYIGPPSFNPDVPMDWHTSPKDNILAPIALARGMEFARKLKRKMCIVDPEHLWEELHRGEGK